MLSAACPRTRAHHSAAHPCHSTRQVSSHADGAQGSTTARTVESTSTAARCPWARQRCNTGQTAGMDLTLSHERGGAVVQRVHLLRSLAVGVGAHVQLLGPLPEEHLEQGAAASLPRERWKSRVMQEPGRGTTPQDRTRRQATHRDIARPPAARPVLRRAHVRRRGHPPARRPHVITAGARAWVGHENHRTAGARRCRQHAEPASAACFAPHPVPSPCLAPPQAPPPPSPLRHTCFCFAFSPRGRMNAIIPPKSEIYACIYFRRQSNAICFFFSAGNCLRACRSAMPKTPKGAARSASGEQHRSAVPRPIEAASEDGGDSACAAGAAEEAAEAGGPWRRSGRSGRRTCAQPAATWAFSRTCARLPACRPRSSIAGRLRQERGLDGGRGASTRERAMGLHDKPVLCVNLSAVASPSLPLGLAERSNQLSDS